MNEKLISKIKKLFILANDKGATLNEAENAMRMARKLLDKHNLSIGDLAVEEKEEVGIELRDMDNSAPWIKQVVYAISTLYNCKYFTSSSFGPVKKHIIIGNEANRVTSSLIIDQLLCIIRQDSKGKGAAFRNGAAVGIWDTVYKIQDERRKEEATPGTGLMLLDVDRRQMSDAEDFLDNMNLKLTTGRASKTKSSSEGRAYGKSLSVNPRLSNRKALN